MRAKLKLATLAVAPIFLAAAAASAAVPPLAPGGGQGGARAADTRTPKAASPIDLIGNWVAIVNEDWRWRMVTPPKGDYASVPLTPAGKATADTWTEAQDGSCKAYGVGGLMRIPTRLQVSWASDDTLKIDTDAGVQTRTLQFGKRPEAGAPRTLQGFSVAVWRPALFVPAPVAAGAVIGEAEQPRGGSLEVTTTNSTGGWVRKNGVPYSQNATVTEYFDRMKGPDGAEWLTVTTVVEDPVNFVQPFLTSTHFKREPDNSKWRPRPCRAD